MPYEYVIHAIGASIKHRQRELHEEEVPTAMLAVLQAEMNRDKKTRKKPFALEDFYVYAIDEDQDSIDGIYGAAAKRLISDSLFPSWALFIYKDLMQNANNAKPPEVLCYQSSDVIILAPQITENNCKGMLIAMESASGRVVTLESPCGKTIRARMPKINSKVIAEEGCYIDLA